MNNRRCSQLRGGILFVAAGGMAVGLAGCGASAPSKELINARTAYADARTGVAGQYAPAEVQEAQVALRRAEAIHEDDPGSVEEQNAAYIAWRRAQLATTNGRTKAAQMSQQSGQERYQQLQEELRLAAEGRLESTEDTLDETQDRLAQEAAARMRAEAALAAAIASLNDIATVEQQPGGMTITIEGAVLFEFGKSELLPLAKTKLEKVADVLKQQEANSTIRVVGHTDSVGTEDFNEQLSQERAESVRSFLVEQGMEPDRIVARGMGETQPMTSNDSPEGRANNRRVEIVVENPQQGSQEQRPNVGTENQMENQPQNEPM